MKKDNLELIADTLPGAVITVKANSDLEMIYANDFTFDILGYTRDEMLEKFENKLARIIHEDNYFDYSECQSDNIHLKITAKDDVIKCLSITSMVIGKEDGFDIVRCIVLDETDTMRMIKEVEISRREIEGIANSSPGGISKIVYSNRTVKYLFLANGLHLIAGYSPDDEEYSAVTSIIHPEDLEKAYDDMDAQLDFPGFTLVYRIVCKSGEIRWIKEIGSMIEANGVEFTYICVYNDITTEKLLELQTEKEKERLKIMLHVSDDILYEYNIESDVALFQYNEPSDLGNTTTWRCENFKKYIYDEKMIHHEYIENGVKYLTGELFGSAEVLMETPANHDIYLWQLIITVPLKNEQGEITEVVGVLRDINSQKLTEYELHEHSKLDMLTGLYKREHAEEIIAERVSEHSREKAAVVLIDIDNFRLVNEQVGYVYGNNMLKNLAERIQILFPPEIIAGRIGADELVIYLPNALNESVVIDYCKQLSVAFNNLYNTRNNENKTTISIGFALTEKQDSYDVVIRRANTALQYAKKHGANLIFAYDSLMESEIDKNSKIYKSIEQIPASVSPQDPIINEIQHLLVFSKNTHDAINTVLGMIGQKFDVSRVYIFDMIQNSDIITRSYYWCREGINLGIEKIKNSTNIFLQKSYEMLFDPSGYFYCNDINKLRHWKSSYDDWYSQKINNLTQFAFVENGAIVGFFGLDRTHENHRWTSEEIRTLSAISGILSNYVIKLKTQNLLETDHFLSDHVIQHLGLFVYMVDVKTFEIQYVQNGIAGLKEELSAGQICYKAVKGLDSPCKDCPLNVLSDENKTTNNRVYDVELNIWMDINASLLHSSDNKTYAVISSYDVTKYVKKITDTDTLTSAPTLTRFEQIAEEYLSANMFKHYYMLYINLQRFRTINDTYGFSVGNRVIIALSNAISSELQYAECYGRISGDKFIVLKEQKDGENKVSHQNQNLERLKSKMIKFLGDSVNPKHLKIAAGVYDIKYNSQDISSMIDKARLAGKTVGANDANICAYYDESMASREAKNMMFENRMETSLATREFRMFLQPKYDLKTRKLIGAEALVRWITHEGITYFPDDFIPLFEQNGFIKQLDFFIYEEVMILLRRIIENDYEPVVISINVSRMHINDDEFILGIYNLVERYEIPIELVELELTESLFIENEERLIEIIGQLHELGFKISIDDFGSGYSSLNLLKDLPVDILKLDKSFFNSELTKPAKILLESVANLSHNLGIEVICEGIETSEQADFAESINVDYAQGYLFSKPIPATDFEEKYFPSKSLLNN